MNTDPEKEEIFEEIVKASNNLFIKQQEFWRNVVIADNQILEVISTGRNLYLAVDSPNYIYVQMEESFQKAVDKYKELNERALESSDKYAYAKEELDELVEKLDILLDERKPKTS